MSVQSATAGMAIHPSVQGSGVITTTTAAIVGSGQNSTIGQSTLTFPNGLGGPGGGAAGQVTGFFPGGQGGAGGGGGSGGAAGGAGQVVTTGYMQTNINATQRDITNLMKYFNSILAGMVLLSNETEDTKQVLTIEEGFTLFSRYQDLGHKVTVTMLSGEAAKVLYGAK